LKHAFRFDKRLQNLYFDSSVFHIEAISAWACWESNRHRAV